MKTIEINAEQYSMKFYKSADCPPAIIPDIRIYCLANVEFSPDYCVVLNVPKAKHLHDKFGDIIVLYWKKSNKIDFMFKTNFDVTQKELREMFTAQIGNKLWLEIGEHIVELLMQ